MKWPGEKSTAIEKQHRIFSFVNAPFLKTGIPEQSIKLLFREKSSKVRGVCRTKRLPVVKNKGLDEELNRNTAASNG